MQRMSTIKDVARKAGVGIATVSRVINKSGPVSEETREKVLAAMDELQYYPNEIARSLKRKNTRSIGLALPGMSNPFFGEIAEAIEIAARHMGYSVLFCSTHDVPEQEEIGIDLFLEKQVDGLILFAPHSKRKLETVLKQRRVPIVIITPRPLDWDVDCVRINDMEGAYEATVHLIHLGHRRIGYIAEPDVPTGSQERLKGYKAALKDHDLVIGESLIVRGTFREGSGTRAAEILLDRPDPPTAIFAANDLMAIEAMAWLREHGYEIPDDMSVVGFDDVRFASVPGIDLTTVAQPKWEVGQEAVRLLISRLRGKSRAIQEVVISPYLVVRKSSGQYTGDDVVLIGAGYMGLLTLQGLVRGTQAGSITVFETNPERLEIAKSYSPDFCFDPNSDEGKAHIERIKAQGGADVVIEFTGAKSGYELASSLTSDQAGKFVLGGWHRAERAFDGTRWHLSGVTVYNLAPGSNRHFREMIPRAVKLVERGVYDPGSLVTHVANYRDAAKILAESVEQPKGWIKGVITF